MPFVIRDKTTGKYAKGRLRHMAEWVEDINEARIYPSRGPATNSLRETFGMKRYRTWNASRAPIEEHDAEIIEVTIVPTQAD